MEDIRTDYIKDFKRQIAEFAPDFVGISIFSSFNEKLAFEFINSINEDYSGKVLVGGMHVKIDPSRFYEHPRVDALILGECETIFEDILSFLSASTHQGEIIGKSGKCNIPNFAFKINGEWHTNSMETISDVDKIPPPDWSLFDNRNFYRPFDGKILRMGHIEVSRGCPYSCTYCINETMHKRFRGEHKYYRIKNISKVLDEVNSLVHEYKLEAIKIWDDDLFAIPLDKFRELCKGLRSIGIKFLSHARPENVTLEKAKIVAEAECIQVGIGVESGNELYRRKYLKRFMKNETLIKAFDILKNYNIVRSAYCMIGMPDETRNNIFDTIRLFRRIKPEVVVQAIFVPYKGNSLYNYAEQKGYLAHLSQPYDYSYMFSPYLRMPTISDNELMGLNKTFNLYIKLPKIMYPFILFFKAYSSECLYTSKELLKDITNSTINTHINSVETRMI